MRCKFPANERLRAYASRDNATGLTGTGTITSSGANVSGVGTYFNSQIIAGDNIIAGGQAVVVTSVASNTSLTVNPPFSPNVTSSGFTYNGYFVNPVYDATPNGRSVGYPGGMLAITSNGTTAGSAIVWGLTTAGDAVSISELWSSPDTFTASTFAVPTIVNGKVYIPTFDQGLLVYSH